MAVEKWRGKIMARHIGIAAALASVSAISLGVGAAPAFAQPVAEKRSYNIEAQALGSALSSYAEQSGIEIIFTPDAVRGKRSNALRGSYSPAEALTLLLRGTGLAARRGSETTILVEGPGQGGPGASAANDPGDAVSTSQAGQEILVTGTRIRGGQTPSPVISIGARQIREEGFANLGEVIRSVPQNFSGGQNPGVSSGNISGAGLANQNLTGGSALNLRGLGPDATLTLLNGRRLAYGGFVQSVDISTIPVAAVERVEILPDGASAIYGSDAVGGVGNVILRRDFKGLAIAGRVGGATDGGLDTQEYSATAGTKWASGGFIAAYQDTSVDPIYARQRRYADFLIHPTTLYPGSHARSGLVSAHQELGGAIYLRIDGLRSKREQEYHYFLSGVNDISTETTTTLISPSVEFRLPAEWTVTLAGAWGKDDHHQYQTRTNVATGAFVIVSNNLYGNRSRTYEANAEGPLFVLSGGDARLAVGGGYRMIDFLWRNRTTGAATVDGTESAKFAYAELNLPLIGPDTEVSGIRRLALTAAIRGEDYSSFGSVATPKIGIIYQPSVDVTIKSSWGRSFKAPTLLQRFRPRNADLYHPTIIGGTGYPPDATVLLDYGGNPDLKPERAESLTASLLFHPEKVPGLQLELTGFHIDFSDRVVEPIPNILQALANPINAPFIDFSPTAAEQAALLAAIENFYNGAGAPYDPAKVVAIVNQKFLNVARQKLDGLDFSGSFRSNLGTGRITLRGSMTWIDSSQQVSTVLPPYALAGTLFNPAKLTGRAGAVWDRAGLSASVFVNYKSGIRDTVRDEKTAPLTTVDATLSYSTREGSNVLSGLDIALSVHNLFDRAPPLYRPVASAAFAVPYDSTNYSPIGRLISLSIAKRF